MYVSVDMDKMRFLHKHEDFMVVSDLAWIENPTGALEITPVDNFGFLKHNTELELHLLYKNTTGEENVPRYGQELRSVIFELMEKIPVSDVVPREVRAQAEFLVNEDHENYHYVKGAYKPAQLTTLFQDNLKAKLTSDEIAAAAIKKRVAPKVIVTEDRPVQAVPRSSASNKHIIWNVMNEIWFANGAPKDVSEILKLRRLAMARLEAEYGIKKTSSSSELGNWQKSIN